MTDQTLAALLEQGTFAILTASEPQHETLSGGNAALRADLETLGYQVIPVTGVYQGKLDGEAFLVPGLDRDIALLLGRAYGQNEVLLPEGSVECQTGLLAPVTGQILTGDLARTQDYHSVLPNGLAFAVGLDFTTRVPVTGLDVGAARIFAAA